MDKQKINSRQLGLLGERIAQQYLTEQGFTILYTNYKYGRFEIDIIAEKHNVIHFIEVKTRIGKAFGDPITAVNRQKIKHLKKVIDYYLDAHKTDILKQQIQIDAITIVMTNQTLKTYDLRVINDIY